MTDNAGTVFIRYDVEDARDLAARLREAARDVQTHDHYRLVLIGQTPEGMPLVIQVQPSIEGRKL